MTSSRQADQMVQYYLQTHHKASRWLGLLELVPLDTSIVKQANVTITTAFARQSTRFARPSFTQCFEYEPERSLFTRQWECQ